MAPPESVPSATVTDLATARRDRARGKDDASDEPAAPPAEPVSADTSRRHANRRFDAEKVARLKAEIAAGRYQIDSESVADRFIEHERNS